jgi:hypothetical protein
MLLLAILSACRDPAEPGSPDADGDGWNARQDCDDANPDVHPGATEACNLADDDCDGEADEDWDRDRDGVSSCPGADSDCNDGDDATSPAGTETADGVDEDCDRLVDCADPDCGGTACDDGQPCTSGDVCNTTAGACVGAAVSCVSDACADRVCNGTAACTVTLHPGVACPDDGNPCTTDVCDGAGACTHPALPGLSPCPDDGNFCTNDVCDASARCVHPLWDGRHCPFGGVCCGGACVDNTTDEANCGTCGIRCPSGRTCTAGACNCVGNAECVGAGYGPLATCFVNRCQCVCTGNPNDRVECLGQCAGYGTCAQVVDLNYCYYP